MRLTIDLDCDNAAFEEDFVGELTYIFRRMLTTNIVTNPSIGDDGSIRDSNGNTVGQWRCRDNGLRRV